MKCQEAKDLIPLYLDKATEGGMSAGLEAHLKVCEACQRELRLYRATWQMLGTVPDIEPKPGYVSRFWTRVAKGRPWHEKIAEGLRLGFGFDVRPVLALAAMVIIGTVVFKNDVGGPLVEREIARLDPEEIELIGNMEFTKNYEVIENIELLEDLEILEGLDPLES